MTSHRVLWKQLHPLLEQRSHSLQCLAIAITLGQLEKHLKSSLAARKGAWKVKIKNNFSGPEKLFFLFASGKGLPQLQLRFGQLENHLKSSLAARKGAWKVKIKNNFSGPEKLFFLCQWEGSPAIAITLWAAGKAPEKLTGCSQGCLEGENKKQLFRAWKIVFSFCQWEGSPAIAIVLWAAGKHLEHVSQALFSS